MLFLGWQGITTFIAMVVMVVMVIYAFAKKVE